VPVSSQAEREAVSQIMFSGIINRKLGASAIPAHLSTLSVSWLNGQFKAVAVHRGSIEGTWENPAEADDPANFEALVREAIQKAGFRGSAERRPATAPANNFGSGW